MFWLKVCDMMARRGVLGLLAGGAAVLLRGCGLAGGNSYRFKMTVEVETFQGLKSGSSVYEVRAHSKAGLDPSGKVRVRNLRGEALAVDLPDGKVLFALLKTVNLSRDDLSLMSMAALDPAFKNDWVESAQRIASGDDIRSPAEVAPSDYPLLVTFSDLNDPATVVRVDPADLASNFGSDMSLKKITVTKTDEFVTRGIETRLDWLPKVYELLRRKTFEPEGIPVENFKGLFSSELAK